jgi:pyruvate dehydrogenase E1 component alpha subunit
MGTSLAREHAQTDRALRAASYGLTSWPVDGMDVHAVRDATRAAVEAVRAGAGPHFLEVRTYRFRAHSMYDSDRYRDKAEIAAWKERDPITSFTAQLQEDGVLDAAALAALEADVARELDEAVAFAEDAAVEPVESLTRHVYSER